MREQDTMRMSNVQHAGEGGGVGRQLVNLQPHASLAWATSQRAINAKHQMIGADEARYTITSERGLYKI